MECVVSVVRVFFCCAFLRVPLNICRAGAVLLAYDNIAIISCRDNEISTFVSVLVCRVHVFCVLCFFVYNVEKILSFIHKNMKIECFQAKFKAFFY